MTVKGILPWPWHWPKRSSRFRLCLTNLSQRLTPAGRAIALTSLVTAIPSWISFDEALSHMWSGATATLVVSWFLSQLAIPNLRLTRRLVQPVLAGTRLTIMVDIENRTRRTAYGLTVRELNLPDGLKQSNDMAPPIRTQLAPGEQAVLTIQLDCIKRGVYQLSGLCATSSFPLGVCRGIRLVPQPDAVVVYPAYTMSPVWSLYTQHDAIKAKLATSYQPSGSTEFVDIRDYRPGDNPRHLHWKAWARIGSPVIKIHQDAEAQCISLLLVTDTALQHHKEPMCEAVISAVASIGATLIQDGWQLKSLISGGDIYQLDTDTASKPLQPLLMSLARVSLSEPTNWPQATTALTLETQQLHTVVAVLLDWSSESTAFVKCIQLHQITIHIFVIRNGPTTSPAPISTPTLHYQHLTLGELSPQPVAPEARAI